MLLLKAFFNFFLSTLPSDFTSRTREQRQEFEEIKTKCFELTEEELKLQAEEIRKGTIERCKYYLGLYGIAFTGEETDFSKLWSLYIIGGGKNNPPMNEWLGDKSRLEEIVKDKITNNNNFEDFTSFVISYEG